MVTDRSELAKLYFQEGLPGFPDLEWFSLTQEKQGSPFFSLHSLQDDHVGFWMIDPFAFFSWYDFTLDEQTIEQLEISDLSQVFIANIITMHANGQPTVNLKAPIVVNKDNCKAKQVILSNESYSLRHTLNIGSKQESNK
jgi:flagellar assembly factor FliW